MAARRESVPGKLGARTATELGLFHTRDGGGIAKC